jgi:lipopolysaccharide transport system ATP-binding protein
MKPIIEVHNISKLYKLYHEKEPYQTFRSKLVKPWKFFMNQKAEDFWALKKVSFEVEEGQSIGIIGKNGAGKSTLLKVLSKITPPTTGKIISRGRIASLLEVGTGFHPELTGRENIFLNGAILGMKRLEILRKFDEIVDFSGVERFLDTPLKHYSSGMQLRLAFAVAAFLENEILIIDEVLAVGDTEFRQKCMGKMDEVTKQQGRTILLVSHDLNSVAHLTSKSLYLQQGIVQAFDNTEKVISLYTANTRDIHSYRKEITTAMVPKIVSITPRTTLPGNIQHNGKEMKIDIEFYVPQAPKGITWLSVHVTDRMNRGFLEVRTNSKESNFCRQSGLNKLTIVIPKLHLYRGMYQLNLYLSGLPYMDFYDKVQDVCQFEVVMPGSDIEQKWKEGLIAYVEEFHFTNE